MFAHRRDNRVFPERRIIEPALPIFILALAQQFARADSQFF